jgi:hypothetical protein
MNDLLPVHVEFFGFFKYPEHEHEVPSEMKKRVHKITGPAKDNCRNKATPAVKFIRSPRHSKNTNYSVHLFLHAAPLPFIVLCCRHSHERNRILFYVQVKEQMRFLSGTCKKKESKKGQQGLDLKKFQLLFPEQKIFILLHIYAAYI